MVRMLDEVCDARDAFVNKCSSAGMKLGSNFVTTPARALPNGASEREPGGCCPRRGETPS